MLEDIKVLSRDIRPFFAGKREGVRPGEFVQYLIEEQRLSERDAQRALRRLLEEGPLELGPELQVVLPTYREIDD